MSSDGINWTTATMLKQGTHLTDIIKISSKHWGDALLVCCHNGVTKGKGYILRSEDDFSTFTEDIVGDGYGFQGFASNTDIVVAVADKYGSARNCGIAYSEDSGLTWKFSTSPDAYTLTSWYGVCWGRDKFIAVGFEYIVMSTDGKTWSQVYTLTGKKLGFSQILDVKYLNGRFICSCNNGGYLMSTDGINWTGGRVTDENGNVVSNLLYSVAMI